MATVHLGRMRSETGFGRTVAIKRMHPHFASDPDFVAMFFDEARLAMRLQHPNIVPTFDVVSTDDEVMLVMEYIHGESLAGLFRAAVDAGERIPRAIASSIVCGVLAGLHAAHEAHGENGVPLEIVHRDVSPQNVMVGTDGGARLLDFGIAKAAGRMHSTAEGQVKGKFAYMAPEQLTNGEVDRRTDLFAASVVLWEALTGRRLFRGDTPGALVNAVLSSEIAPPSSVATDLPRAIDHVVMRGLARQKLERFATARDMAAALEEALPPATARAVGEWTMMRAAPALEKRALLVRDVESGAQPGDAELPRPVRADALSGHDEMPSEVLHSKGISTMAAQAATATKSARRWGWVLAAVVASAVATTGVAAVRRAPSQVDPPASIPAAAQPSAPSLTPAPERTPAPAIPSASSSEPAPAASPALPSPPPRPRSRPHASPPKPDCSNPFVVDSRGLRVPRPECF
jgi:serine/threonine protein kinase